MQVLKTEIQLTQDTKLKNVIKARIKCIRASEQSES